jgi:hypothetical protein|tara:strand:+ start:525 stop:917 length:393 start_codon:yes stop_codon:yes gene_type:complete
MEKFYTIFNSKIIEFLNDLIKIFPDDNDFKMYKNGISLVKLADEKKPLQLYKLFVNDKYKENILTKNEEFFLSHDYNEILTNDNLKKEFNGDINNKIINKLKGYWKDLSSDNREIVWNYFTLFLKISNKI